MNPSWGEWRMRWADQLSIFFLTSHGTNMSMSRRDSQARRHPSAFSCSKQRTKSTTHFEFVVNSERTPRTPLFRSLATNRTSFPSCAVSPAAAGVAWLSCWRCFVGSEWRCWPCGISRRFLMGFEFSAMMAKFRFRCHGYPSLPVWCGRAAASLRHWIVPRKGGGGEVVEEGSSLSESDSQSEPTHDLNIYLACQ